MITGETIKERKTVLLNEMEVLQENLSQLEEQRIQVVANINAMRGAIQTCDFFLAAIPLQEKKEDE